MKNLITRTTKKMGLLLIGLLPVTLLGATITVTSLSALQTAINNAAPGDVIILANGSYTASSDINISKQGTAAQPVTIQAQSIGGVTISGTAGINIASPARYIIIKGFRFTFNASQATMASGTSFCRWTRNLFETPGDGENLSLNGNDHEVDYNTFQHKNAAGRFITVRGTGSQIAQRLHIHHNYFLDQNPQSGNGIETLQFGLSGYSLSSSNSIVEYNLFEQCEGENELISVKASAVILRYNTIRDCPAQFTLRHGNRCQVYGNYFINTPGLRIFGDDHVIYSNHFENCSPAINIGNGDGEVADGDPLTAHDRPDRCLIAFNTLVNNASNYVQSGRTNGLGATNITFANNIIQGGGAAASIAGPYTGAVWSGNIIYQTNGAGAMPSSGYQTVNPLLARDATGTFHLQSGSPAIDAASGSYSAVTVDMDGQARPSAKDKGADEVSTAPVIAQILSPSMVGQNGSTGGSTCEPVSASADDGNVPANVLDNDLNTRWSANGDGQWIQFCLSSATTVSGVQIAFYSGDTRTSSFDVLTSNDGVSFTNAATGLQSSGTSLNLETFTFSSRTAKYVRIVGHGNSVNAWNSYTEVKIQTGTGPTCQPVTASADDGNVPANVLDNDLNTRWSANGDGQWIQFCLSSTVTVSGVQIAFYNGDTRTSSFDILTGSDGVNFTTAAAGLQSSGTSLNLETFSFSARSAKYVRIVGHGNSVNAWNSYTEVKIQTGASQLIADAKSLISYPNPFHQSSTISFYLEKEGHANLTVSDITGKQVAVLVNKNLPAGNHRVNFSSNHLPAGVYLLKLLHNGAVITRKILKE